MSDWVKEAEENHIRKDKECIYCDKFFECDGKPKDTQRCINFVERKKK